MEKQKDGKEDSCYYTVRFNIKDHPIDDDIEDFVYEFTGEVIRNVCNDRGDHKEAVIGKVRGERVDLGEALNLNASIEEIFDVSSELYEVYAALFNPQTDELLDSLKLESFGDVLVVHSVEIVPEYRGLNLGLLAMLQTIKTFGGGCAIAAIKPFPLQFSSKVTPDNEAEFVQGQNKLREHWKRLGFRRAGKTDFYYLDLVRRFPRTKKFVVPSVPHHVS